MPDFNHQPWYQFLDEGMRDLVNLSYLLFDSLKVENCKLKIREIHDFSFIVFPMAKAYEGFLKKWFFANAFITEYQYKSDHFRIGKALNPSLPARFKNDGYVYDQIVAACPDPHLSDQLWQCWKQSRNLAFHYFPHHRYFLTLPEANARLNQLAASMAAVLSCRI
ncbi:hypothetical protein HYU89_04645 [Candidatus Collierbacteria bacterium]|nr:hypothetical protein [Candidatus Collierbacteria bacterium]